MAFFKKNCFLKCFLRFDFLDRSALFVFFRYQLVQVCSGFVRENSLFLEQTPNDPRTNLEQPDIFLEAEEQKHAF